MTPPAAFTSLKYARTVSRWVVASKGPVSSKMPPTVITPFATPAATVAGRPAAGPETGPVPVRAAGAPGAAFTPPPPPPDELAAPGCAADDWPAAGRAAVSRLPEPAPAAVEEAPPVPGMPWATLTASELLRPSS